MGEGCPPQVGHNDLDPLTSGRTGLFIITKGHEEVSLWVSDGSHKRLNEDPVCKRCMADIIRKKLITIPPNSSSIGHGCVQHASAGFTSNSDNRFHMYHILQEHPMKDAFSLYYSWSFKKVV